MESKFKRIVSIVITIAVIMTMTVTPGFAQDAAGEEIIPEDTVTYTYSQEVGEDEAGYNDELFEKYVEAQLYSGIEGYSTEKVMLRSVHLSDMNQMIFDRLKEQISEVAAGNSTSTVFTVSLDDLGIEGASWTAEELGVSSSATTNEIYDALMSKLGIDLYRVYDALIAECAYELYWHDKSQEGAFSMSSPGLARSGSGSSMRISMSGVFTFRFQVAEAYSAGEYTVNTENIDRVHTAVENANATVSKAAILSDEEKLTFFKNEICGLVTYDTAAAEDDSTPYGDQWQLISVFDGDDTTNVVCEGYSKAFKYLCDLTEFDDPGIGCILVSGTMRGATGAGAHMWNIVTINGENYLVDVTNCDDGTIGAPDQLFLKGNENGSVTDGYTFTCEGGNVSYAYDEETMSLYEEELELAKADYSGNEEGEVEKYVESMEFKAMPRLRKDVDASLSATAFDGDTVTLNYSDGSSEVYVLKNWNFISQTTETTTDESARISISYDDQNHVDFASYNNGDIRLRADDPGASYVAQSMELTSSGPVELIRGLDSVTKTDASGNEYEEYNLERLGRYSKFLENDSFKVTYKNGLDEEITVDYVYTDSTGGFTLAEDNPFYTGYPSDNYFGTYFEIELPDQSVDHFEVGQTYYMDVTYHEKGSNFDLTPITTEGKPYSLKITQAGPEDVTSISFTDDIV